MNGSGSALLAGVMVFAPWFGSPAGAQEKKPAGEAKKPAAEQKKPVPVDQASIWMRGKLEFSKNILEGLTTSDFDKISTNARSMTTLGFLEKYSRGKDPDYKRQLSYFEFANFELIRQAKDRNLDGATLAYNQLTSSCVQCHKLIRGDKK